jgi:hypothetical protein
VWGHMQITWHERDRLEVTAHVSNSASDVSRAADSQLAIAVESPADNGAAAQQSARVVPPKSYRGGVRACVEERDHAMGSQLLPFQPL